MDEQEDAPERIDSYVVEDEIHGVTPLLSGSGDDTTLVRDYHTTCKR